MSADDETTGPAPQDVPGEAPAKEPRAPKRAAAKAGEGAEKKPSLRRKPSARKKVATEKQAAENQAATEKQPVAEKEPAVEKQPVAEKQPAVEKQPVAEKQVAEEKQPAESSEEKRPDAGKPAPQKKAPAAKPDADERLVSRLARRRTGAAPTSRRKVVRAHARYVRTSARKARMVCGHLRGKSVQEARAILAFTPREVARDWSKLLESAVANAESNHELLEDDLIVREAYADEGPTIKRFRPRAMGRATPIRKRTSHLTITLTPSAEPGTTSRRG
jgi:ribosomal protein L22